MNNRVEVSPWEFIKRSRSKDPIEHDTMYQTSISGMYLTHLLVTTPDKKSIDNFSNLLNRATLAELREIHDGFSFNAYEDLPAYAFGDIVIFKEKRRSVVTNISDKNNQVVIERKNGYWDVHFIPFGKTAPCKGLEEETMFLGCVDMIRMIDRLETEEKPRFIVSDTNSRMAAIATRKLHFQISGGKIFNLDEERNLKQKLLRREIKGKTVSTDVLPQLMK